MTPSADTAAAVAQHVIVPDRLLHDGEAVILAVKPSGWYVPLVSWPVLVAVTVVGAALELSHAAGPGRAMVLVCAAAGCLRVILACIQWMGLLYVLTDRRVLKIRGLVRGEVTTCMLADLTRVGLSAAVLERPLGLGSIHFELDDGPCHQASWTHLARPREIAEAVNDAIRRLPPGHPGIS